MKTTMTYHLTPVRMTIIKRQYIVNICEDAEKREPNYTIGRNINWYSHYGKQYENSSKN